MTPDRWHQVTEIFHAARQYPAGPREAFLADACGSDNGLRHEVEALLRGHDEAQSFGETATVTASARLEPGDVLMHWRVESLIGRGGMGEVYRARDTMLERDVAIKVLPAAFVADPAWLDRLEREARALAALNHPNIATIYGIERAGDVHGLVLEFVDGPTLAERLAQRRLPFDEALSIAEQLVDALAAAHERGIIHRDIKPSNLKIARDGTVKVLDFGLAKMLAIPALDGGGDSASEPTNQTREGAIVGTAAYMSPEQARGQAIDRRTDIWAFGCVLFEMLIGREIFAGETRADTLAAVLEREPPWEQLPPATPESIRRLLRRCLEKDLKRRLRDIGDARFDLDEARKRTGASLPSATRRRFWPAALGAVAIVVAAAFVPLYWRQDPGPKVAAPSIRFTVAPKSGTLSGLPSLSPDGRRLAFINVQEGVSAVWIRTFDSLEAQRVPGSEGAQRIGVWSPDGQQLLFYTGGTTWKIADLSGRSATRSAPGVSTTPYGAMWCPDGRIVVGSLRRGGLFADSLDGSAPPKQLTSFDLANGEGGHLFPTLLPDGRHFLYLSEPSNTIWIASLDSKGARLLMAADSQALYVPSGYLLFVRRQTLFAQRFDPDRLELTGEPFAVAEDVLTEPAYGADFAVSQSGAIAYRIGTVHALTQLKWVDRSGRPLGFLGPPGRYANIELSPDGSRVVMEVYNTDHSKDIWTMDTTRGVMTQLTFDPGDETFPAWSPDGRWILFASNRHGGWQLYRRRADGLGNDERIATTPESMVPQSWAPDGRSIVYLQRPANLGVLELTTPLKMELIDRSRFEGPGRLDGYGQVSPDGQWLLYGSNESGDWEVYLRRFPAQESGKWKISETGALSPRWRPDGREVFYYSRADNHIVAVAITPGPTPVIGSARRLFKADLLGGTTSAILWRIQYAVAGDGRLLLNEALENPNLSAPITVDTNWMAAFKEKAPTGSAQ